MLKQTFSYQPYLLATVVGVVFWGLVYNFTTTYNICWTKVCIFVTLHKKPTEGMEERSGGTRAPIDSRYGRVSLGQSIS